MKKLPLYFYLFAVFAPFACAWGATASRAIPSSVSSSDTTGVSSRGATSTPGRTVASRTTTTTAARNVASATTGAATTSSSGGAVTARTAGATATGASRTATDAAGTVRVGSRVVATDAGASSSRGTSAVRTGGTVSRSAGAVTASTARDNLDAAVNTVGRNARVQAASINNNPTIRRAGLSLRPSTAEVGGRATIAGTDIQTGSNMSDEISSVSARASTTSGTQISTETIAAARERLELTAELNNSCQQQYNDCMDQFCAVVDTNQQRCSCSANLSDYADVERAVTDANAQLNEVAQRIRYVGLSEEEIDAIMSATEAEEALTGRVDTTETRNLLTEIEDLILDPTTSSSYTSSNSTFGLNLDLDLDFTSTNTDLFSLDFLNPTSSSLSNLRGTQLYNAARNRCSTILDECEAAGANIDQITANYDLAIDRDCIAYEQGLSKMNDTLRSNVRSATLMLQQARLAVMQNQNTYDAKGCIAALDECMRDDMVCGDNYTKCLDPTKRYIDENGDVVLGENITHIIRFMDGYNNARINQDFLRAAYTMPMTYEKCSAVTDPDDASSVGNNGACVAGYLLKKIGTGQEVTDEGLCRAVLDKCQTYTYDDNGNYLPYNDVVVNYIQRAMVNIQAAQRQIVSDYASNCVLDIANCYNQQVTQVNSWSSSASVNSVYNVMRGACRNVALTCAYAVFQNDPELCGSNNNTCLESISAMFYQSLLCPDNSVYDPNAPDNASTAAGYVNGKCKCIDGFTPANGQCLEQCQEVGQIRNASGVCQCDTANGWILSGDNCVCNSAMAWQASEDGLSCVKNCGLLNGKKEACENAGCVFNVGFCRGGLASMEDPLKCSATDKDTCEAKVACSWNEELGRCEESRVATTCSKHDNETACLAAGCSWTGDECRVNAAVGGGEQVLNCSIYSQPMCEMMTGCRWNGTACVTSSVIVQ